MELLKISCSLCLLALVIFVSAERSAKEEFIEDDITKNDEVPRVKIKVFRGPGEEQDGTQFTTWGFWVKQPAEVDLSR